MTYEKAYINGSQWCLTEDKYGFCLNVRRAGDDHFHFHMDGIPTVKKAWEIANTNSYMFAGK